jgi:hypothetical protein
MRKRIALFFGACCLSALSGCATNGASASADFTDSPDRTFVITEVTLVTSDPYWSAPEGAHALYQALPIDRIEGQLEDQFGITVDTSPFAGDRDAGFERLAGPDAVSGRNVWTWRTPAPAGGRFVIVRITDWPDPENNPGRLKVTAFVATSAPDKPNASKVTSEELNNLDLLRFTENAASIEPAGGNGNLFDAAIADIKLPDGWAPRQP